MKAIKWVLGLCLILAIAGGVANYLTPYPRIWVQTCGLNLGLIQVKDADWGFLKLRAGQAGLNALRDLERHGATDKIRQVSVAVQEQWLEAGHVTPGGHLFSDTIQEKETRFIELRMPLDGKTLRQYLLPGQRIPETFWQTQRFRLPCILPPPWAAKGECSLHMVDLTGDAETEILFETRAVGTRGEYIHPVIGESFTIYKSNNTSWLPVSRMYFCHVDQISNNSARPFVSNQKLDILWLNDHAVNFFDTDCVHENSTHDPEGDLAIARNMAPYLIQIPILFQTKTLPSSLIDALKSRNITLSIDTEPALRDMPRDVRFNALPPCFVSRDPKSCAAIIADIDHDGSDDVIILDRDVKQDAVKYRLATLLSFKQGQWTVINSHAVCADPSEKLEDMKIALKPSPWKPIGFAGKLYLPSEDNDSCTDHYFHM